MDCVHCMQLAEGTAAPVLSQSRFVVCFATESNRIVAVPRQHTATLQDLPPVVHEQLFRRVVAAYQHRYVASLPEGYRILVGSNGVAPVTHVALHLIAGSDSVSLGSDPQAFTFRRDGCYAQRTLLQTPGTRLERPRLAPGMCVVILTRNRERPSDTFCYLFGSTFSWLDEGVHVTFPWHGPFVGLPLIVQILWPRRSAPRRTEQRIGERILGIAIP